MKKEAFAEEKPPDLLRMDSPEHQRLRKPARTGPEHRFLVHR